MKKRGVRYGLALVLCLALCAALYLVVSEKHPAETADIPAVPAEAPAPGAGDAPTAEQATNAASAPESGLESAENTENLRAAVVEQTVHGNPKSKIYHNSSCRYFGGKSSTAVFGSAREARENGYRPCQTCGG